MKGKERALTCIEITVRVADDQVLVCGGSIRVEVAVTGSVAVAERVAGKHVFVQTGSGALVYRHPAQRLRTVAHLGSALVEPEFGVQVCACPYSPSGLTVSQH